MASQGLRPGQGAGSNVATNKGQKSECRGLGFATASSSNMRTLADRRSKASVVVTIEGLLEIAQNSAEQMRNGFGKMFLILLVWQVAFGLSSAQAGPFDFLRRIRDSIAHPRHHPRTPPTTPSKRDNGTTVKRNDLRPPAPKEP